MKAVQWQKDGFCRNVYDLRGDNAALTMDPPATATDNAMTWAQVKSYPAVHVLGDRTGSERIRTSRIFRVRSNW